MIWAFNNLYNIPMCKCTIGYTENSAPATKYNQRCMDWSCVGSGAVDEFEHAVVDKNHKQNVLFSSVACKISHK